MKVFVVVFVLENKLKREFHHFFMNFSLYIRCDQLHPDKPGLSRYPSDEHTCQYNYTFFDVVTPDNVVVICFPYVLLISYSIHTTACNILFRKECIYLCAHRTSL